MPLGLFCTLQSQLCTNRHFSLGEVQKHSPKGINKGNEFSAFWEIAEMASAKTTLKALTKALTKASFINKGAFWEKAEMVKCKKNIPKGINEGKVPFGR
jgi:hypothetical protein